MFPTAIPIGLKRKPQKSDGFDFGSPADDDDAAGGAASGATDATKWSASAAAARAAADARALLSAAASARTLQHLNLEPGDDDPQHPHAMTRGVVVNPPPDTVLRKDDELIVISLDDDAYQPRAQPALRGAVARELVAPARGRRETFLFCGWRRDIDDMIILLDSNVVAGSELHLLSDVPFQERATRFARGGFDEVRREDSGVPHQDDDHR